MGKPVVTLHSQAYQRFAKELISLRERAGLTQRELALRTGMAQSQVAKHELGARRMDVIELGVVCQACGELPEEFVRRLRLGAVAGDPPPAKPSRAPKAAG